MANYFHRQLGYYADAHRDRVNSVMHMIGNPILFVAVVLPLCLLPVSVSGVQTSPAPLLTIPVLVLWTAWDVTIGLAIVVTSIPLLLTATNVYFRQAFRRARLATGSCGRFANIVPTDAA